MEDHEYFMGLALKLARKGEGRTSPNPMVGAVIVRDGRIIGEGYHACCGENHAEINAILAAREPIAGATFYITLEPCTHQGRTPPCVEALLRERPARVVIGAIDPNPVVAGRGVAALQRHGRQAREPGERRGVHLTSPYLVAKRHVEPARIPEEAVKRGGVGGVAVRERQ